MFTKKKLIVLCDMQSVQDDTNGDRTITVANARKIIGDKDLVGIQTQTLAQMQDMVFNYSITIDRMFYNEQKYLYTNGKLYKIQSASPAKHPKDCKLNVIEFADADIKTAIERWLNGV